MPFRTRCDSLTLGRYQWGRKNHEYAINADYTLNTGNTTAAALNNPVYNDNGQILTNNDIDATDLHIYGASGNNYDWAYNYEDQEDRDKLWGNGIAIGTPTTSPDGIPYNNETYQSPVKGKGDPCPDGWRVPTQDEWERIGAYDCRPDVAGGTFSTSFYNINGTTPKTNSPFTWVPVVCGGTAGEGQCIASNTWGNSDSGTNAGYAVYRKEDWTNRQNTATDADLLSVTAPEPFLFLPSAGRRERNSGIVTFVSSNGFYWSSTADGVVAQSMSFTSSTVYPASSSGYHRACGYSIRCVAE